MGNKSKFYLEDTFIESPLFDNWFKKHYPQKSLLICSPYIKKDALDRIIDLYNLDKRDFSFELKVLIRGNEEEFTHHKSSDISIFDSFISIPGLDLSNVRRIKNLHMKAYLIDGIHLLISSGNLTNSGIFVVSSKENFEGGISTNNPSIILSFLAYFRGIWSQSEELSDFYDDLLASYKHYIETDYSDKATLVKLSKQKYSFPTKTKFHGVDTMLSNHREEEKLADDNAKAHGKVDISLGSMLELAHSDNEHNPNEIAFSLDDIPPVGTLEHLLPLLQKANLYDNGISYLELGKELRPLFSSSTSTSDGANRKFGEEKGKFAAFLNLVSIEETSQGNRIIINNLGRAYLQMNDDNRNKLIKDIFFSKTLIVSIMRQSLEYKDFNLFNYLLSNCQGATKSTLSRKVGPLKDLFHHISLICSEQELRDAMQL